MHPSIYLMFVVMATHFSGIESFNVGRNVSILVSRDDSRESSITNEATSKKRDVKTEGRLVKNNPEAHKIIFDGPMFRQVVEQNGFSNDILGSQIANFLASTQRPPVQSPEKLPTPADDNRKSTADDGTFIGNLDDISFEVRDISVPVINPVIPAGGQVSTNNARHFKKQSDERDEDDDDDNSNEVRSSISASRDRIHLDATDFHKRPEGGGGMLIQPESEDWLLVRQYMDDEQFRGAGKELAKEYFWQPVKGPKGLDSESEEDDSNESS